jgi:two-component system NarL family response regulator
VSRDDTVAGPPAVIRILLADDHPIFREGLALILDHQDDMRVVGEACDGEEAVAMFARLQPDVAILDLQMPRMTGAAATAAIVKAHPTARVLLLTTYDGDEDIYRAMHAGARGYLLKGAPRAEVLRAIRAIAGGQRFISPEVGAKLADRMSTASLTGRELEVLRLLAAGKANKEIGAELSIAEGTIKAHVSAILQKLGATSRTEAVLEGVRRGLLRG